MLELVIQIRYTYNTECNFLGLGSLRDTLCSNYHWFTDPKFDIQCIGIFQRWQTNVNLLIPELHYVVVRVTSSGYLKVYLNPQELCVRSLDFKRIEENGEKNTLPPPTQ